MTVDSTLPIVVSPSSPEGSQHLVWPSRTEELVSFQQTLVGLHTPDTVKGCQNCTVSGVTSRGRFGPRAGDPTTRFCHLSEPRAHTCTHMRVLWYLRTYSQSCPLKHSIPCCVVVSSLSTARMKVQIPSETFTAHFMGRDVGHWYVSKLSEPALHSLGL